jgi:hypothetical protein
VCTSCRLFAKERKRLYFISLRIEREDKVFGAGQLATLNLNREVGTEKIYRL